MTTQRHNQPSRVPSPSQISHPTTVNMRNEVKKGSYTVSRPSITGSFFREKKVARTPNNKKPHN